MTTDQITDAEIIDTPTTAAVSQDLVTVSHSALVVPAAERTEIVDAFRAYTRLKKDLLDRGDYQSVSGKTFIKKSGWRKLACAFGVSVETVAEDETFDDGGLIVRARVRVRAVAPNGRSMEGLGVCHRNERKFSKPEHDIPATAFTRAVNRACSDLFGFGEVSAEELSDGGAAPDAAPGDAYDPDRARALGERLAATGPEWLKADVKQRFAWRPKFGWTVESCDEIEGLLEEHAAKPSLLPTDPPLEDRTKKRLFALCNDRGIGEDERHRLIKEATAGRSESANDLTQPEAVSLIHYIEGLPKP